MSNLSLKDILKAIFVLIFSVSFYSFDLPSREGGLFTLQKAHAFGSFKVSGLEVKGNKKIEADAILGRLDLKKGPPL